MNTDLDHFHCIKDTSERPVRPPGHPPIPITQWKQIKGFQSLGAIKTSLEEGICGAPSVEPRTGNMEGFFMPTNRDFALPPWMILWLRAGRLFDHFMVTIHLSRSRGWPAEP